MASITVETTSSSSSSSSSSSLHRWKYDVFLSFRSEDTRKNFTDHLYAALYKKGVSIFRSDKDLGKGKPILSELLKAIEESRFAIIILSRHYAWSTWCLDELVKVVECMKQTRVTILPIFYDVDPSDACYQRGSFAQAFAKHEEDFKGNTEKVQRWKDALREVANLPQWHLQDRYESTLVNNIVKMILGQLNSLHSNVSKNLIGIDFRIEEILNLCKDIRIDNACFVGIYGLGGIGKTTLARAIYKRISFQFESSIFLANVREETRKRGLVALQRQLLSKLLAEKEIEIYDIEEGADMIENRLGHKSVLIILDDVDHLKQLYALTRTCDSFGQGSKIIITTRNKRLLIEHEVAEDKIYEAKELNYFEALQLFSWKAFKEDHPPQKFVELSKEFLNYAKGHPLALEVLGSSLYCRSMDLWKSMLSKVKENPDCEVQHTLRVSYDELLEMEKNVFLDIACFFKGEKYNRVKDILESCGYHPDICMDNLINKSLLTIQRKNLWLHDLLEDMGQEIIRLESPEEPGKWSRLWLSKDINQVLKNNTGTKRVEGIVLKSTSQKELHLNAEAFIKLKNLRLLRIYNIHLPQGLSYLSNELRTMEWLGCPLKSLPKSFAPNNLVELIMPYSYFKNIWKGKKDLYKLKIFDLSASQNLRKTPDFTGLPNLEKLILQDCTKLCHLHPSIGDLKQLILLNLRNCISLYTFPYNISLDSLEILILSNCLKIKKFPEIIGEMKNLLELHLDGTAIKELPLSMKCLTGLTFLNLKNCKSLLSLPDVISSLTSLKSINLSGSSISDKMAEDQRNMEHLEELDIRGTAIRQGRFHGCKWQPCTSLFSRHWSFQNCDIGSVFATLFSNSNSCSLTSLDLSYCNLSDGAILNELSKLSSLQELHLAGNKFEYIPESISQLSKLQLISLNYCSRLQSLPKFASSVQYADLKYCTSLETYSNEFDILTHDGEGLRIIKGTGSECKEDKARKIFVERDSWLKVAIAISKIVWFNLREDEFPMVFNNLNNGCSVKLQPIWDSDNGSNWLGCVLYFVFEVHYHEKLACLKKSVSTSSTTEHHFYVHFDTEEGPLKEPLHLNYNKGFDIGTFGNLVYIPRVWFAERSNSMEKWCFIQASITSSPYPSVEVQMCGAHLLSEQNAGDFAQTWQTRDWWGFLWLSV